MRMRSLVFSSLSLSFRPCLSHTHTRARTHTYTHTRTPPTPPYRDTLTQRVRANLFFCGFKKHATIAKQNYGVYGKNMIWRRAVAQAIPACHQPARTNECLCICLACACGVEAISSVPLANQTTKIQKKSTPSLKLQSIFASAISMFLFSKEKRSLTHSSLPGAEKYEAIPRDSCKP